MVGMVIFRDSDMVRRLDGADVGVGNDGMVE